MATFGCVGLRYWLPSTHLIATDYHLFVPSSLFIGKKKKKGGSIPALFIIPVRWRYVRVECARRYQCKPSKADQIAS
jgi:hypothetical protein